MTQQSKSVKGLLNEYQRAVRTLSQLIAPWQMDKLSQGLASEQSGSCLDFVIKTVRESFGYISWVQKSAGLPGLMPPQALKAIEQEDLRTIKNTLSLLGPYGAESLSGLTDAKLQYRPVREYTLEQMLERSIVHIWLAVGKLEGMNHS